MAWVLLSFLHPPAVPNIEPASSPIPYNFLLPIHFLTGKGQQRNLNGFIFSSFQESCEARRHSVD